MNRIPLGTLLSLAFLAGPALGQQKDPPLNVKPDVIKKIEAALPDKAPATKQEPRFSLARPRLRHGRFRSASRGALMAKDRAFTVTHSDDSWFEPES